jgi:hypothetical protein
MKEYDREHGIILTTDYSENITLYSTVIEIMPVWKWSSRKTYFIFLLPDYFPLFSCSFTTAASFNPSAVAFTLIFTGVVSG